MLDDLEGDSLAYKDSLIEQRDSLIEKLIDFAVGTGTNTAPDVKRTVRISSILVALPVLNCIRSHLKISSFFTCYLVNAFSQISLRRSPL